MYDSYGISYLFNWIIAIVFQIITSLFPIAIGTIKEGKYLQIKFRSIFKYSISKILYYRLRRSRTLLAKGKHHRNFDSSGVAPPHCSIEKKPKSFQKNIKTILKNYPLNYPEKI
jgi:hypothetical protein